MIGLSNKRKTIIYVIIILVLMCALYFELSFAKISLKPEKVSYTKTGSINYVTYLKDNNHYANTYLEDDYNLVASFIDYFNFDYNYAYVLSESIKYKLDYDVVGYLDVYDSDNDTKPIEKKKYQLYDKKTVDGTGQVIKVELFNQKVFYDAYNKIVQDWKKEISPNVTLRIIFNVNWTGFSETLNKEISDTYVNSISIPISEKTINITKPEETNISDVITSNETIDKGILLLIASTLLLLLTIIVCLIVNIVNIMKRKSRYEIKINKILREFDRAITEAKGNFIKDDEKNYIEVNEFMELMDVHDNLNEPIIYYKNSENRSVFTVRNGEDIYYWTITRSEYDKN